MSAYSNAKNFPERPIPHWISSTIIGIPSSFVTLLTVCRNFTGAGITPPSPCIGSNITAAGFVIPLSGSLSILSKYSHAASVPASPPSPKGQR